MKNNLPLIAKIEFYSLCVLAFSLPILEVSKHISSILLIVAFIIRYFFYRGTIQPSPLSKYFLIFIGASVIASIGALFKGYDVLKLHDILRYSAIGIIVIHIPLSKKQMYTILYILVVSLLIGIMDAYYSLSEGVTTLFQLRSVGHINHSSIYILLIIGITLPLLLKNTRLIALPLALFVNAGIIYVLFDTNSRATVITLSIIISIVLVASLISHKKIGYILCILATVVITYLAFNPPPIINKFNWYSSNFKDKMTPREKIWNTTFYAWKKEPIFGIGYGNYQIIKPELMKKWYAKKDIDVNDKNLFLYNVHAHNRYMNTLVEGGVFGLISLIVLLSGIAYFLALKIKQVFRNNSSLFFWMIGSNTLITISIAGLFNTTLSHEHGMLAMLLIAISANFLSNKDLKNET